jgi:AmmeMemoRadiSam system protein B
LSGVELYIDNIEMKKRILLFSLLTLFVFQIGLIVYQKLSSDKVFVIKESVEGNLEVLVEHKSYFMNSDFFDEAYQDAGTSLGIGSKIYGGIIPHHLFVKERIAGFFKLLETENYKTVILIGPNHFDNGQNDIISSRAKWMTPYGELMPDLELIDKLDLNIEEDPFIIEHSISGLVSFIKKSTPDVKFVPIILKEKTEISDLDGLINKISNNVNLEKTLVLASVDFSHYQSSMVAKFHDNQSNAVIQNFDYERIFDLEIDSPASIYLLLKYLELNDIKKSTLLSSTDTGTLADKRYEPTTSHNIFTFQKGNLEYDDVLNFLFMGDMMLDRNVKKIIDEKGLDYIFEKLKGEENRFFRGIDMVSANLEGTVADGGKHYAPLMSYDFSFDPNLINELHQYNFNFFNLANNHLADQGEKGIQETRKNLDKLNFNYSGCMDRKVDECSSKVIELNGYQIGMAGFSMVYGKFNQIEANKIIQDLKNDTDLVIVNVHWGVEYTHYHNNLQQETAYSFIDNGADMIIGHHPHVVQGMEIYKGKPIFYSLGNFIFDQYFSDDTQEGLGVGISTIFTVEDELEYEIYLYPLKSINGQNILMGQKNSNKFLQKFIQWSDVNESYQEQILNQEINL